MKSIKEAYRNFLNTDFGTQLYNLFKLLLYKEEDSLIQILNNNLLQSFTLIKNDTLDVCDIGGGDGNRIVHILKFLHSKFDIKFRLDFIEQSRQFSDAFKAVEIDAFSEIARHHALFEDVNLDKKYDLVFLIHSIFAFQNGKAIDKVVSLTKPGGKIVIVANAPNSFLGGLKALMDDGYDDKRYEVGGLQGSLESMNVDYDIMTFQTKWAIDDSRYGQDMKTLFNWISLGRYDIFDADRKKLVKNYVNKMTNRGKNKTLFCEDEIILVIPSI